MRVPQSVTRSYTRSTSSRVWISSTWRRKRVLNASDSTGLKMAGKPISSAPRSKSACESTKTVRGVSTPALHAASICARLSYRCRMTSQREKGMWNQRSRRPAWREMGQMYSS